MPVELEDGLGNGPMPPDYFREIGFDTHCWPGKTQETIFFIATDRTTRLTSVRPEAVAEFVKYWEHQIAVAKDYVKHGCNPNTHEWNMPAEPRIKIMNTEVGVHAGTADKPRLVMFPIGRLQGEWGIWSQLEEPLRSMDPPITAEEWKVLEIIANTAPAKNGLSELRQALARTTKVTPRKESSEK